MQDDPRYEDVLLDVYDFLNARIAGAMAAGISRDRIMVDPGIGFGKTATHNLLLVRRLSLFHDLGVPVLLGVSRKRFIGAVLHEPRPRARLWGTASVCALAVAAGARVLRVHDVGPIAQVARMAAAIG